jgi:hypothetical protein
MIRSVTALAVLLLSAATSGGNAGGVAIFDSRVGVAVFDSGNDLYTYCQQPYESYAFGLCAGFVTGYFEMIEGTYNCPIGDKRVTREQLVDIVMKYLRNRPEDRHEAAGVLAGAAFKIAFKMR